MGYPKRQWALKHGWRSGLEKDVAQSLKDRGASFEYESEALEYVQPEKRRKYTPDFIVTTASGKALYIETKGRWVTEDRQKMALVIAQHPDKEFRFVFQRPHSTITKASRTTYAVWCQEKLGASWAAKDVPDEWLLE